MIEELLQRVREAQDAELAADATAREARPGGLAAATPRPRARSLRWPIKERSEVTVGRPLLPFAGVGMPSRSGATQ